MRLCKIPHFKSLRPLGLMWLVKMWDKRWEFGAGDPGSILPGGQFTQRPTDRGHLKHSALMATEAEGFAIALHSIPPLVTGWPQHCSCYLPAEQTCYQNNTVSISLNEPWTAIQWWMEAWPLESLPISLIIDQFYCGNRAFYVVIFS